MGSFSAALPTPPAAVPITISLTAGSITAGSNTSVIVAVHSSLSVYDLVNASPVTYLPLTCSPVTTTKVGAIGTAIANGGSGPLAIASPGLSQSIAKNCAVMITDGTHQAFGTTSADAASGASTVAVTTAAGAAWTAKYAIAVGNEVDLLTATDEDVGQTTVTGGSGAAPAPGGGASCAGPGTSTTSSSSSSSSTSSGTSGTSGTSPSTAPSTGSLAFTGPSHFDFVVGLVGLLLLDLGYLVLTTVDRPRRLIGRLLGRSSSSAGPGPGDGSVRQS
ncbi:MAG TPA: hypothetical protein DCQ30_16195 [Acidimicrobiaceae bacterium]|nr:hypothetical protein [Acidimicrobiaceae bacterium]